jgi:hypothetical protein
MAARKALVVDWPGGVCLREQPTTESKILAILPCGEKITPDPKAEAPKGWVAVAGGGFTMARYLK